MNTIRLELVEQADQLKFYRPARERQLLLPLMVSEVAAGFPSPAEDYLELALDLNEYLIKNPSATFFVRASGESMKGMGIYPGDLLIVDRSVTASHEAVVIAVLNGEFTVKQLSTEGPIPRLLSANKDYPNLEISPEMDFKVWGVVSYVIHKPV